MKDKKKILGESPESLDKVRSVDTEKVLTPDVAVPGHYEDVRSFILEMMGEVKAADGARESWKDKQKRYYKKRFGIRPPKSFPWPGCSNLHIPLIDKTIRKLKPSYISLLTGLDVMCYFDPENEKVVSRASDAENFFDWLLKVRMKVFKQIVLVVDRMLSTGWSIVKVIYSYHTRNATRVLDIDEEPTFPTEVNPEATDEEIMTWLINEYNFDKEDYPQAQKITKQVRDGKRSIKVSLEEVEYDAPKWIVKTSYDVIVPADTTDFQSARWICDIMRYTTNDLRKEVYQGKYDHDVVEKIISLYKGPKKDMTAGQSTTKQQREGVYEKLTEGEERLISIWEIFCYFDINEDGIEEKCVLTVCPASFDEPLRFIEFPYEHNRWPFVQVPFEITDDGFNSSRGIPEILDYLQTELCIQHNSKIDRQTMSTAQMFKYIPGIVNPNNVRFIPGQGIPVNRMDALEPIQVPNVDFTFVQEEQILKAWGDEYIGQTDFGAINVNPASMPAKQKNQVLALMQQKQLIFSLDGQIVQDAFKDVFEQTWALWCQYGPEDVEFSVTGKPPKRVSLKELQGNYELRPAGKITGTNPLMEAQRALAELELFKGDPYINQKALRDNYLRKSDPRNAATLLLSDELIKKNLDMRAQMGAMAAAAGQKGGKRKTGQKITAGANPGALGAM